jgi:hypothetical protein
VDGLATIGVAAISAEVDIKVADDIAVVVGSSVHHGVGVGSSVRVAWLVADGDGAMMTSATFVGEGVSVGDGVCVGCTIGTGVGATRLHAKSAISRAIRANNRIGGTPIGQRDLL